MPLPMLRPLVHQVVTRLKRPMSGSLVITRSSWRITTSTVKSARIVGTAIVSTVNPERVSYPWRGRSTALDCPWYGCMYGTIIECHVHLGRCNQDAGWTGIQIHTCIPLGELAVHQRSACHCHSPAVAHARGALQVHVKQAAAVDMNQGTKDLCFDQLSISFTASVVGIINTNASNTNNCFMKYLLSW